MLAGEGGASCAIVMPGLEPGIQQRNEVVWMAGSIPVMTSPMECALCDWSSFRGHRRMNQRKADSMKARPSGNSKTLALLAMLGVAGPLEAKADIQWNWSYLNADTKITASGTLTTKDQAAGSYGITSITGVWNGAAITGLEAIHSCCSPPGWNDNVLVDGNSKLGKGGFAFSVSGGPK